MGAKWLSSIGAVLAVAALARPSAAAGADAVLGPTSQANVRISVSVAPRVQLANFDSVEKGGLLCLTGTKLGATATMVRGRAGAAPREVPVPIATGSGCNGLADLKKLSQLVASENDPTGLLVVAPQ